MKKECSFCGRNEHQVKLLISGLHGYICEECAVQAYEITQSAGILNNDKKKKEEKFSLKKVPKPKRISTSMSSVRKTPSATSRCRYTTIISACSSLWMPMVWR